MVRREVVAFRFPPPTSLVSIRSWFRTASDRSTRSIQGYSNFRMKSGNITVQTHTQTDVASGQIWLICIWGFQQKRELVTRETERKSSHAAMKTKHEKVILIFTPCGDVATWEQTKKQKQMQRCRVVLQPISNAWANREKKRELWPERDAKQWPWLSFFSPFETRKEKKGGGRCYRNEKAGYTYKTCFILIFAFFFSSSRSDRSEHTKLSKRVVQLRSFQASVCEKDLLSAV